jgi:hypothetical protein
LALDQQTVINEEFKKMGTDNCLDPFEHFQRMESFYRDQAIVSRLEKGEIPFAVIVPKSDNNSLQELAQSLKIWKSHHPFVRRVLGSDRMQQGKLPKVSVMLLMVPFWYDIPESWIENVVLVTVAREGYSVELAASLCCLIENGALATVYSWRAYSDMNR